MPDPEPEDDETEATGDHDVPADLVEVHEAIEWMEAVKDLPKDDE